MLDKKYILIVIAVVIFSVLGAVSSLFLIVPLCVFGIYLLLYYKKDFLVVALILISYLTFTGPKLVFNRTILNIVALILLSFLFFRKYGLDFKNYPKLPNGVILMVLLLFFSFALSSFVNGLPALSSSALIRMSTFFFICYMIYGFLEDKKHLIVYISVLFIVFFIISIGIYIEIIESGFSILGRTGFFARYSGFYESPNYVGIVLIVVTLFLIVLLFKNTLIRNYHKYGLIFILINITIISIIINSRASLLGTLTGLLTAFAFVNKKLLLKFVSFSLALTFLLIQIPEIHELFDLFLRLETISEREHLWNAGLMMFADYPIFGVGPDMFRNYFFNYVPSSAFLLIQSIHLGGKPHSHNFFLFMANENGLLGFISSVAIFALFFYYSYKAIKFSKNFDNDYYLISIACLGICAGYFIRSFFDVEGILAYGYLTRDLPFWLVFIISVFIYNKMKIIRKI